MAPPSSVGGAAARRRRRPPAMGQVLGLSLDRAPQAPPLYHQIRAGVRSAVLSGALGGNRTTVMRAYQELAADGVVKARPGRSAIVCAPAWIAAHGSSAWGGAGTRPAASLDTSWLLGLPAFEHGNLGPDLGLPRDMAAFSARDDLISFAAGMPAPD